MIVPDWLGQTHTSLFILRGLVGALMLLLVFPATPVQALNLFGFQIFGTDEETPTVEDDEIGVPVDYTVAFTFTPHQTRTQELEADAIRAASSLWQGRNEPAIGVPGLVADARSDYRRLLATLYANGFYGSVISIRLNGTEAADVAPDAELAEPVAVAITVDSGPVYRFGQIQISGQAGSSVFDVDEGLRTGAVARSGVILRSERLLLDGWRQRSHAYAQITTRVVEADHPTQTVDVTIDVDPGAPVVYGATFVEGAQRMDPDFVAYMADLPPGESYNPDDIAAANARLAALEVFRSVRIEQAAQAAADGSAAQTVYVQERPLRRIGAGGTLSSVDGLGLEAYWLHRNLFGRAERFRIDGRVSGIDSVDPDDFTYSLDALFTRPGVLSPDTRLMLGLGAQREVLDAYERTGAAAEVALEHPFSPQLTGRFSINGRHAQFDDDVFGQRDFTSAGFQARLTYDSRDLPSDASSGFFLEGQVEPFYEFSRNNPAIAATAEARAYYGIGDTNRFVLAGRLRVGSLVGASIAETAPDRLFLTGGGSSVRGYAYRNIGVEQSNGLITGGRSLLEGSVELRARITDTVGAVAFADFGTVGADTFLDFEEDLKVGIGGGLRYLTPLGPIRLDVAVPLDPGRDDPDFALYVGIGQAF